MQRSNLDADIVAKRNKQRLRLKIIKTAIRDVLFWTNVSGVSVASERTDVLSSISRNIASTRPHRVTSMKILIFIPVLCYGLFKLEWVVMN
jgi:hypothetical protein